MTGRRRDSAGRRVEQGRRGQIESGAAAHTSTVRSLSQLQGRDPLILTLARGHYCPKEHPQHLELAAN